MQKRILGFIAKALAFCLCFTAIFFALQKMYTSNDDNSESIEDYFSFDDDIEALFLGASQMFCTVNAQRLTEEYGISSYDFGASDQTLPITYYYLQEALQYQHPKLVAVEVTKFFQEGIPAEKVGRACRWNYALMPMSLQKYRSVKEVVQNDWKKAVMYG